MLGVLVQRHRPLHLLRRRIDLDRAGQLRHRFQDGACYLADRPIRAERNASLPTVAVLYERFVGVQVEDRR